VKILVTGGAGFIGSNLIKKLVSEGNEVVSLDDYSTGDRKNHIEGVKYINCDIEQIEYIKGKDIDLCYHLAAQSRVQPSFDDPTECLRVNVNGTEKVMEWADNWDIRVVYAGSSSKHHDPTDSPYAMYKYLGEEVCKLYKKTFDVNVEICRFYNVYGPGESLDEKYGSVIGIWRTKVSKIEALPIVGDGEQKRDFIHVDDIVDGLIKIGFGSEKHEDAWELGVGVNYSINEIYRWFNERFWIESTYIPEQKGNYRETLNTNTDTKERLGWEPKDRLKEYIQSL
jgi:UDP-glucose 4-epimerase